LGDLAVATGVNAAAVGPNTSAAFGNSTAVGNGAATTRANQVVIGTSVNTVTVPGVASAASLAAQIGPTNFVTSDAGGNLATSPFGPSSVAALDARVGGLEGRVGSLETQVLGLTHYSREARREARGGIAVATATSQIRYDNRPGKLSLGIGTGYFISEGGIAAGLGYTSESQLWRANVSAGSSGRGDWSVGGGVSFTLN